MDEFNHCGSLVIAASAEDLYDMVADVTRTGEWSPICKECWWEDAQGPVVGSWFLWRNVTPERTWETRSVVVAADRGKEFAFQVLGDGARWGYTFEPVAGGTLVTESWQFLPAGQVGYRERFGDEADARLAVRRDQMREGIRDTLAAIKAAAERGCA